MKKDETIDINIISINEALVLARNSKKVELIQLIEIEYQKSRGEAAIEQWLIKHKIEYSREYSYSDLKGFLDDMRSELIGMCIEIGLVYIIIEKSYGI